MLKIQHLFIIGFHCYIEIGNETVLNTYYSKVSPEMDQNNSYDHFNSVVLKQATQLFFLFIYFF